MAPALAAKPAVAAVPAAAASKPASSSPAPAAAASSSSKKEEKKADKFVAVVPKKLMYSESAPGLGPALAKGQKVSSEVAAAAAAAAHFIRSYGVRMLTFTITSISHTHRFHSVSAPSFDFQRETPRVHCRPLFACVGSLFNFVFAHHVYVLERRPP